MSRIKVLKPDVSSFSKISLVWCLKVLYYLEGTLKECSPQHAVVEVMGLGFYILIPASFYFKMPVPGSTIKIYTCLKLKDEEPVLYGFPGKEERDFFNLLTSVSGIGPKVALSLMGHLPLSQLSRAILLEDLDTLTCIPGIGSKTAKRLVYELKEKIAQKQGETGFNDFEEKSAGGYWDDVQQALQALGYAPSEIKTVRKVIDKEEHLTLEELFKKALVFLAEKD